MKHINRQTLKYLISVFIFGTIGCFLHYVDADNSFVVLCMDLLGALFIALVLIFKKDKIDFIGIKNNLVLLIISGIAVGLNWIFLFTGYRYLVSLTSLCNYTAPIIVLLISVMFFNEKINYTQVCCIVAAFFGIILISGILSSNKGDYHAIVFGLLAALCFVVIVLVNKRIKNVKPLEKTAFQLFISALTVLPMVLINHSIPTSIDTRSIIIIIILGLVHMGLAYSLYFDSIYDIPASKIAVLGYVEPVTAVISGVLILKENLNLAVILGALLIIGSSIISELSNVKK